MRPADGFLILIQQSSSAAITLDELLHGCSDAIPDQYRQFIKSYDELNPENQKNMHLYMHFLKNQEKYP